MIHHEGFILLGVTIGARGGDKRKILRAVAATALDQCVVIISGVLRQ